MAYIGKAPGFGIRNRYYYTATASQTLFSGADDNGQTLAYADSKYLDVYLNGVLLVAGTDYTATTLTSVSLTTGAAASDIVEIVAYDIFSVADTVSAANGGTFNGAITIDGGLSVDGGTIKLDGNYPVGTQNTALGDAALDDASLTGCQNVAVGNQALTANACGCQNVAVGWSSLLANTTGIRNTALGRSSMVCNSSGYQNTAVGEASLFSNTTGFDNTASGTNSLYSNTSGCNNTAFGRRALFSNTTASNNTAVGYYSLYANTTGTANVAVGYQALTANTTASNNTAVGYDSLSSNTTGGNNTAVGRDALRVSTTGTCNTAVGDLALADATTQSASTAVGYQALGCATTGAKNTAIGFRAGNCLTTGQENVLLGNAAGCLLSSGNGNTFLGYVAGADTVGVTTGCGNVVIGFAARPSANNAENQIVIGKDFTGNGDNKISMGSVSGYIWNSYTVNASWTQVSDCRLKSNIQDDPLGLSFINALCPKTFTWTPNNELPSDNPHYRETNVKHTDTVIHGMLAQDVKAALDAEGVTTFNGWEEGADGIQALSREMFVTPLINAVKELKEKNDALEARLSALENAQP